ncbi:hypothetical protein [Amycolatopsis sp.]|uniref:hypothetical protein n=1 Tax=Amycolatopsis sp. TaxID=37632 RepID=UPI002E0A9058|nr:hypothetical protein [Amycolatopsis sp.]
MNSTCMARGQLSGMASGLDIRYDMDGPAHELLGAGRLRLLGRFRRLGDRDQPVVRVGLSPPVIRTLSPG